MPRTVKLLPSYLVEKVRRQSVNAVWTKTEPTCEWYVPGMEWSSISVGNGTVDRAPSSGRATCRACGEKIAKGERAFTFVYSFTQGGSYTCTVVWMHESCSGNGQ